MGGGMIGSTWLRCNRGSVSLSRDHLHWGRPHDHQVISGITTLFVGGKIAWSNDFISDAFFFGQFCCAYPHYCSTWQLWSGQNNNEAAKIGPKTNLQIWPPRYYDPVGSMFQNNSHSKWVQESSSSPLQHDHLELIKCKFFLSPNKPTKIDSWLRLHETFMF